MRGIAGRYGFHCFGADGELISGGKLVPPTPLIQDSDVWFNENLVFGQPGQIVNVDFDDTIPSRDAIGNLRFSFHEAVARAVWWFYGDDVIGFHLRGFNSPGARVTTGT